MKVLTVVGARPQFVKAASVSRAIWKDGRIKEVVVHTGQHYDANMSDIFFEQMAIPKPDYRLDIAGLGHGAMTGRMIEGIENILLQKKPDALMVYGDTNTTLAGAIAASKINIPVIHVEAGLRSFNMKMPEEVNRILTDRVSQLLLCPTDTAVENLHREGYGQLPVKIVKTGDVMYDAAMFYAENSRAPTFIPKVGSVADFVLVTIHRAENTDDSSRLNSIMESLVEIADEKPIFFPVHPRTRQFLKEFEGVSGLHMMDPVGYLEMIWLIQNCELVMTDSGGLQKEALFFRKPCVTLRDETEWVELVDAGVNILAGANKTQIKGAYGVMKGKDISNVGALYGNGNASQIIVDAIIDLNLSDKTR